MNWTFERPTKPGMYLCGNRSRVVAVDKRRGHRGLFVDYSISVESYTGPWYGPIPPIPDPPERKEK